MRLLTRCHTQTCELKSEICRDRRTSQVFCREHLISFCNEGTDLLSLVILYVILRRKSIIYTRFSTSVDISPEATDVLHKYMPAVENEGEWRSFYSKIPPKFSVKAGGQYVHRITGYIFTFIQIIIRIKALSRRQCLYM